MKITITSLDDLIIPLDVPDDMELENFKALCEAESGIQATTMTISHHGKPLTDDKKPLKEYGVSDGDIVLISSKQSTPQPPAQSRPTPGGGPTLPFDFSAIQLPGSSGGSRPQQPPQQPQSSSSLPEDPAALRQLILSRPDLVARLKRDNPPLFAALEKGLDDFARVIREQRDQAVKAEQMRLRMLRADPFDEEAQRLIAEEIQRQNIDSNMETALEYHPEAFGVVTMLYISCRVNGHPVKAFVDSGAQSTIMSQACAQRCNITHLIDKRWAGIAKGVGVQAIIGRVHLCQVQIEQDFLASSFTILQEQPMDMLLGLDMLKRHQCSIDLKRNVLVIGTTGTETPFLSENELPENVRHTEMTADDDRMLAQALEKSAKETAGSSSSGGNASKYVKEVEELVQMGFQRKDAESELIRFNGDKNQAVAALLAKSLQLPK